MKTFTVEQKNAALEYLIRLQTAGVSMVISTTKSTEDKAGEAVKAARVIAEYLYGSES